eukprot:scaffold119731_cov48-Phaeocystis_antarctica.AAC.1
MARSMSPRCSSISPNASRLRPIRPSTNTWEAYGYGCSLGTCGCILDAWGCGLGYMDMGVQPRTHVVAAPHGYLAVGHAVVAAGEQGRVEVVVGRAHQKG